MIGKASTYLGLCLFIALCGCRATVGIYNEAGMYQYSVTACKRMFEWMGHDTVLLTANDIDSGKLDGCDLLCIPAGDSYEYSHLTGVLVLGKIRDFIHGGGGYIGTGGAAAFSSESYLYWGSRIPMPCLQFIPRYASGPVYDLDKPYEHYPRRGVTHAAALAIEGYTMRRVNMMSDVHPITRDGADSYIVYHLDGSAFLFPKKDSNVTILGRCDETGHVLMLACEYGDGRVFVTTTEPQNEENSNRDGVSYEDELDDPDSEWPLMDRATTWALGWRLSSNRTMAIKRRFRAFIGPIANILRKMSAWDLSLIGLTIVIAVWAIFLATKRVKEVSDQ